MIKRVELTQRVHEALGRSRVVALIGPRQCGKTTLAREFVSPDSQNYFDLEDPLSLARLNEPITALKNLKGLVVIDEIHRVPDLYTVLRVLADRHPLPARFLLLGSASSELLRQTYESLAGRLETITMGGFSISEVGADSHSLHWLRGGFPLSCLAKSDKDSLAWRKNFIQTFLERDVPQFGLRVPATTLLRFWTMLAHYNGQIWNAAEPARSLGISESSARRYADLLTDLLMVRQLQPWHINLKKRQVKAPKIYIRDTGLLHLLLGIRDEKDLLSNPKCGASWEGYVIEETIKALEPDEVYFWATHAGAEIDLVMVKEGHLLGLECKRLDAPRLTPSMRIARDELGLEQIAVIYPGAKRYSLAEGVSAVPFQEIAEEGKGIFQLSNTL